MKIAILDIGTNSVIILAIEVGQDNDDIVVQFEQALEPRLGEKMHKTGRLSSRAIERTIRASSRLLKSTGWLSIDETIAFGTHALRYPENSDEFCRKFKERTGREVIVLSAEEEAIYSCQGALVGLGIDHDFMVVDVGGGSTEISRYSADGKIEFQSVPIGAVTLTESLNIEQPLSPEKVAEVRSYVSEEYGKYLVNQTASTIIGAGGTATSLAMAYLKLSEFDAKKVHGTEFSLQHLAKITDSFNSKSLSELRSILFFAPGRADIIAAGCLIYKEIMTLIGANRYIVSQKGVRWGVAKNYSKYLDV